MQCSQDFSSTLETDPIRFLKLCCPQLHTRRDNLAQTESELCLCTVASLYKDLYSPPEFDSRQRLPPTIKFATAIHSRGLVRVWYRTTPALDCPTPELFSQFIINSLDQG